MKIEVLQIRCSPRDRPLRGFADVRVGAFVLRDFRIMRENGGKPYIKAPFVTYKSKGGKLKFHQIIDLPAEVRGQVDTAILSAFYAREKEEKDGNLCR